MNSLNKIFSWLRQQRFPEEFRIQEPYWEESWLAQLETLYGDLVKASEEKPTGGVYNTEADNIDDKLYLNLGTGLFRIRKSMIDPESNKVRDGYSRAMRHLESVLDVLEEKGVKIMDHTGEEWVDGRSISAIAFQPMVGYTKEIILETIRPSIFVEKKHVQQAQVIVGTPTDKSHV